MLTPRPRLLKPLSPSPSLASYRCAQTHTHTCGKAGPQGTGGTKGGRGEGSHLTETMSAPSQEKCVTSPVVVGSTKVPSAPLTHTQAQPPWAQCQAPLCPASSHLPLKTKLFISVSLLPPRGTTDLRSFAGGMWLRWVQ